jgi:hypothetical protein
MYATLGEIDINTLYQGDVIDNYPLLILGEFRVARKIDTGVYHLEEETSQEASSAVVGRKTQRVILLSQTCDIQRRNNIIVCPVYSIESLISDGTLTQKNVDSIKGKKTNYWFYLPAYNNFPESLVDFQTISYVSRLDLEQYKNSRILSLSALGRHNLGWALSVYFSRPVDTE